MDVKYDPSNLGHIYVKDPQSGEYLTVPAVDLEYADKTNLWQHKVVTRWQRRQKAENDKDLSLAEARLEITAILNAAKVHKLPVAVSRNAARYGGLGSNTVLAQSIPHDSIDQNNVEPATPLIEHDTDDEQFEQLTHIIQEEADDWDICTNEAYPD